MGSLVWLNGAIIDTSQAHIAITDRGFTLGDGLFETMLWTGNHIRFHGDHIRRLTTSATAMGIALPVSVTEIEAGLMALCKGAHGDTAAVRLTLSRGSGPRGLAFPDTQSPIMLATIAPYTRPTSPVALATVIVPRNCGAPSAMHKTLSYLDNIMALNAARTLGAQDAVMLGSTGNIACASSANIVVHYKGQTLTPPVADGALPGIVRRRLLASGLVEQASITPRMLALCSHGALTNALIGVRPIAAIDAQTLEQDPSWIEGLQMVVSSPPP